MQGFKLAAKEGEKRRGECGERKKRKRGCNATREIRKTSLLEQTREEVEIALCGSSQRRRIIHLQRLVSRGGR